MTNLMTTDRSIGDRRQDDVSLQTPDDDLPKLLEKPLQDWLITNLGVHAERAWNVRVGLRSFLIDQDKN